MDAAKARTSPTKVQEDEDLGDLEIDEAEIEKLDEDLWYLLKDKLDGAEQNGEINGLRKGEGIKAYHKIYKWSASVTGLALTSKMNLAMGPVPPKKATE
eukprot:5509100-Pyramimonas_sp.AAC.1